MSKEAKKKKKNQTYSEPMVLTNQLPLPLNVQQHISNLGKCSNFLLK